jgi:hypothetical protein
MVKGIDKFKDYFKDYSGNYVIIGGTACDKVFSNAGIDFRATKDIDIILVIEALNKNFVRHFWNFIKEGKYKTKQKSSEDRKYYRFLNPEDKSFPHQLELFSRKPDILDINEETGLTPIPVGEDLSSLSAILLNDDYYNLIVNSSFSSEGIQFAKTETLICLKAKAYIDFVGRKANGEQVDKKDISKHRNDILLLITLLSADSKMAIPDNIKADLREFFVALRGSDDFMKLTGNIGLKRLTTEELCQQVEKTFSL